METANYASIKKVYVREEKTEEKETTVGEADKMTRPDERKTKSVVTARKTKRDQRDKSGG